MSGADPVWRRAARTVFRAGVRLLLRLGFGDYERAEVLMPARWRLRQFRRHVDMGRRVLDVGTGSGALAALALRRGADEVVAVDINPAAVAMARRLVPGATVLQSDLFEAVEGRFDTVLCSFPWSSGTVRRPFDRAIYDDGMSGRFFREVGRCLAPGARLWLQYSDESAANHARFLQALDAGGFEIEARWAYRHLALATWTWCRVYLYRVKARAA